MTQSKIFQEEFEKLYSNIERYYHVMIQGFNPEDIHNLRITIKQLRAFFYLIHAINPDFKIKKNYKQARKLFKSAGKIRDIQVQMNLASTWRTEIKAEIDSYLEVLSQQEVHAKDEFLEFTAHFILKKIFRKRKNVVKMLEKVSLKKAEQRVRKYIIRMFTSIMKSGNSTTPDPKSLHRLRILTKKFRYNLEFIAICLPEFTFPENLIMEIQKVHHLLGLINDHNVAYKFLSNIAIMQLEQLSKIDLAPVYLKIEMERLKLYNEFLLQWTEFKKLFPDKSIFVFRHDLTINPGKF